MGGRALLAALAIFCAAPTVEAAPGQGDAGPAWRPERVKVLVYSAEGLDEPSRRAIEDAAARGLEGVASGEVAAASERSAAAEADSEALAEADRLLHEAHKQVRNLELESATKLLEQAASLYVRWLPELIERDASPQKLTDAYVEVGSIYFLDGDESAARAALGRALVLDPELHYSPERFPPQLEELMTSVREQFEARGRGRLRVAAGGNPNAVVYVNGRAQGSAPAERGGLPAGPNFVQVRAPGYLPALLAPVIEEGGTASVSARLEPAPSVVRGALAGTRKHAGRASPPDELRVAAESLGADGLLLIVPVPTESAYRLSAYLYDLKRGRLVSRARREIPSREFGEQAADLARVVWSRARWEVLPPPPPEREPGVFGWMDHQWDRAYGSKYFWPAVGVTAGAAVFGALVYFQSRGLSAGERVVVLPVVGTF